MRTTAIIFAAACAALPAWGARVVGAQAPVPEAVRQSVQPAAAASHADDSSSLREGVISGVNASRDQVEINGSWLKLAAGKTRIFRQGHALNSGDLVKGQKVKFTLAAGDAERVTLGVVYVP